MALNAPHICSGQTAVLHNLRVGPTDAIHGRLQACWLPFPSGRKPRLLTPASCELMRVRAASSPTEIRWPLPGGGNLDIVKLESVSVAPSIIKHHAAGRCRRFSGVAFSSGRYAASVLRGSSRKRIRRSKKAGAEQDGDDEDDQTDEPYSTLEDAPIFGSVHGDLFDYDSADEAVSAESLESKSTSTGNGKASSLPVETRSETNGALFQNSFKEVPTNGAKQRTGAEVGLAQISPENGAPKKSAEIGSKEGLASGTKTKASSKQRGVMRIEGVGEVTGENGTAVKKKKKKQSVKAEKATGTAAKAEGKVKAPSVKKAGSKTPKSKLTPAPKLKRSKAFNARDEEASVHAEEAVSENGATESTPIIDTTVHANEAVSENGAAETTPIIDTTVHAEKAVSGNGAAESTPSIDTTEEDERLQERLASSLQAGSSASDSSHRNSGSLLFVVKSGSAYVVTSEAIQRLESAESAEKGVLGQALQAATSLVGGLAESAQASGVVPEQITESVESAGESVSALVDSVTDSVTTSVAETVDTVTISVAETVDTVTSSVAETVDNVTTSVAETVDSVTSTVAETVGDVGGAVVGFMTEEEELGDTEFAAFANQAGPQLRGRAGLENLRVLGSDESPFHLLSDAYSFSLKLPPFQFCLVILALPLLMSLLFTGVYLLDAQGLVPDDSVQQVFAELQKGGHVEQLRWYMVFQVFMFSLSLATGLQPVLAPVTPFSFLTANLNALLAQLLFVFLSGSVFARLSQRSRPIRCSTVALICPPCHENRSGKEWGNKVLMARYVLVGTKPSELVDVKVDLTFCYNTVTRNGSYFMRQVSLKLVRSEVAHQKGGMLVRHVIDESSPLYRRSEEMLQKEDAVFKLSVVGLERSSMQSVFELQHYCVADGDVIWNAEFEDVVLVNKSMQRVIDQSKLSTWKSVPATGYRTINA